MAVAHSWGEALAGRREQRPVLEREEIVARAEGLPALIWRLATVRSSTVASIGATRGKDAAKRATLCITIIRFGWGFALAYLVMRHAGVPSGPPTAALLVAAGLTFGRFGPIRLLAWTKLWFATFALVSAALLFEMRPGDPDWWARETAFWAGGGRWTLFNALLLLSSAVLWLAVGAVVSSVAGRLGRHLAGELAFIDGLRRPVRHDHRGPRVPTHAPLDNPSGGAADTRDGPAIGIGAYFVGGQHDLHPEDAAAIAEHTSGSPALHFVTADGETFSRTPAMLAAPPAGDTALPAAPEPRPAAVVTPQDRQPAVSETVFDPDRASLPSALRQSDVVTDTAELAPARKAQLERALVVFREHRRDRREKYVASILRAQWRSWTANDCAWLAAQPGGPDLLDLRAQLTQAAGGTRIEVPSAGLPFKPRPGLESLPAEVAEAVVEAETLPAAEPVPEATASELSNALAQIRARTGEAKRQSSDPFPRRDVAPADVASAPAGTARERTPFARPAAPTVIEASIVRKVEPDANGVDPVDGARAMADLRIIVGIFQAGITFRQVPVINQALLAAKINPARLAAAMELMKGLRDDLHDQCTKYLRLCDMDGELQETERLMTELEDALEALRLKPHNFYRERGKINAAITDLELRVSQAVAAGADTGLTFRLTTARKAFATISQIITQRQFSGLAAVQVTAPDAQEAVANVPQVIDAVRHFGRSQTSRKRPRVAPSPAALAPAAPVAPTLFEAAPLSGDVASSPIADAVVEAPSKTREPAASLVTMPQPRDAAPAGADKKERPDSSRERPLEATRIPANDEPVARSRLGDFYPEGFGERFAAIHRLLDSARTADRDRASASGSGEGARAFELERLGRSNRVEAGKLASDAREVLRVTLKLAEGADDAAFEARIDPRAFYAFIDYISRPVSRAAALQETMPDDDGDTDDQRLLVKSLPPQRFGHGERPERLAAAPEPPPAKPLKSLVPPDVVVEQLRLRHDSKLGTRTVGALQILMVWTEPRRDYINLCGYSYDQAQQAFVATKAPAIRGGAFVGARKSNLEDPVLLFETEEDRLAAPVGIGEVIKSDSLEALKARGRPL